MIFQMMCIPYRRCFGVKFQAYMRSGWLIRYCDSLRPGRSEDPVPSGGDILHAVQTGTEAHRASCTMGTGSLPEVERPRHDAVHLFPYSAGLQMGRFTPPPPMYACIGMQSIDFILKVRGCRVN
jgi:hypothetical protein